MTIPKSINIGGMKWNIVDSKHCRELQTKGQCFRELQEIHLDFSLTHQQTWQTFIHEILHAVFYSRGTMDEVEMDEEEAVTAIAPLLTQAIQQIVELNRVT